MTGLVPLLSNKNKSEQGKDWFFRVGLQTRNRDTPLLSSIKEQHEAFRPESG